MNKIILTVTAMVYWVLSLGVAYRLYGFFVRQEVSKVLYVVGLLVIMAGLIRLGWLLIPKNRS